MAACFAAAKGPRCETVFSYLFYDFYCGGKLVPSVMVTLCLFFKCYRLCFIFTCTRCFLMLMQRVENSIRFYIRALLQPLLLCCRIGALPLSF